MKRIVNKYFWMFNIIWSFYLPLAILSDECFAERKAGQFVFFISVIIFILNFIKLLFDSMHERYNNEK